MGVRNLLSGARWKSRCLILRPIRGVARRRGMERDVSRRTTRPVLARPTQSWPRIRQLSRFQIAISTLRILHRPPGSHQIPYQILPARFGDRRIHGSPEPSSDKEIAAISGKRITAVHTNGNQALESWRSRALLGTPFGVPAKARDGCSIIRDRCGRTRQVVRGPKRDFDVIGAVVPIEE